MSNTFFHGGAKIFWGGFASLVTGLVPRCFVSQFLRSAPGFPDMTKSQLSATAGVTSCDVIVKFDEKCLFSNDLLEVDKKKLTKRLRALPQVSGLHYANEIEPGSYRHWRIAAGSSNTQKRT